MRILLIVLSLMAAALYLKILMPEGTGITALDSITEFADNGFGVETSAVSQTLRPVPDTQLQVIKDVFAPELAQ